MSQLDTGVHGEGVEEIRDLLQGGIRFGQVGTPAAWLEWVWPRSAKCWPFALSEPSWGLLTLLVQVSFSWPFYWCWPLALFWGLQRPLQEWVVEGERVGPWQHDPLQERGSSRRRGLAARWVVQVGWAPLVQLRLVRRSSPQTTCKRCLGLLPLPATTVVSSVDARAALQLLFGCRART